MIALLLLPHAARAGTYAATFTGGTVTVAPSAGNVATPFTTNLVYQNVVLPGYSGVAGISVTPDAQGHATSATATVSGQTSPLTAKFTWQPAQGQTLLTDPAPTAAIVLQDCGASCQSLRAYGPITFSGNDGLGGSVSRAADASTHSVQYVAGTVAGDNSVSVSCSPDAVYTLNSGTAVGTLSSGNTLVTYNPTITPVYLNLGGTTLDPSKQDNILIGQGCTANISGLPGVSSTGGPLPGWKIVYAWDVKGTTFQGWTVAQNQTATPPTSSAAAPVKGFGKPTDSSIHWYWNEKDATENVTCAVTLTPPVGQGAAFTVTVTRPVIVADPTYDCRSSEGKVYVVPDGTKIKAISTDSHNGHGETWFCNVLTPALFGSGGLCNFTQTITPNRSHTYSTGKVPCTENGKAGLDTVYPYLDEPGDPYSVGIGTNVGWPADNSGHRSGDSVETATQDKYGTMAVATSISVADKFYTFLMYVPPGADVSPVPLHEIKWGWSATPTKPATGWANVGGILVGTVTATSSVRDYTHPTWTRLESTAVGSGW